MNDGNQQNPKTEIENLRLAVKRHAARVADLEMKLAESEKTAASFKKMYFKAAGLDKTIIPQMPPGTFTN